MMLGTLTNKATISVKKKKMMICEITKVLEVFLKNPIVFAMLLQIFNPTLHGYVSFFTIHVCCWAP